MCGRYDFGKGATDEKMVALIKAMESKYPGMYKTGEILPGDTAPAVIARSDKIIPVPAIFGFPGFSGGRLLINARAETAAEKKTFAESMKERRVILPATGFYEWDAKKTKYLFTVGDRTVFYLCGLYRIFDGQYRFVILTRADDRDARQDACHRGSKRGAPLSDGSRCRRGDPLFRVSGAGQTGGMRKASAYAAEQPGESERNGRGAPPPLRRGRYGDIENGFHAGDAMPEDAVAG